MPQSSTGTTGLAVSGTWPSISGGKQKWAPAHGSNPSTSPHTSCPGSACTTRASGASPSQTGAKTEGKPRRHYRPNLLRWRRMSTQERPRDARRSSIGPSSGLDRYRMVLRALDTRIGGGNAPHNWRWLFITIKPFQVTMTSVTKGCQLQWLITAGSRLSSWVDDYLFCLMFIICVHGELQQCPSFFCKNQMLLG